MAPTLVRLRVLPQILPVDGREIELRTTATFVQWRYVTDHNGEYAWQDLIALSDITGPAGPAIELRVNGAYIQYRTIGAATWIDLIPISDLVGPKGDQGDTGPQGPSVADGDKSDVVVSSGGDVWLLARRFATVAALLADTDMDYVAGVQIVATGQVVDAQGFRYMVAASGASDQHVTTAGGVKLYVQKLGGAYYAAAFGAKEDGVTNDAVVLQKASDVCNSTARPTPLKLTGMCLTNSPLIINRAVGTPAGADTFTIIGEGKFAGFTSALAGAIIDSNLPFIGPFNDTPACNIRFENITFLGAGNVNTTCVSDKFLKVHFEACRFNQIKCVVATYYLQSWRWHYCSMIAWPGWFCSNVGPYYDCHWDECDFESGADGIKSFESGFNGSSITKCLFENSGRFFAQSLGFGTTIIGNYTEANSAPDYQLSDPVNYGPHRGTIFTGNFMGIHSHGLYNVIVGDAQGMLAGGNFTDTRLYDTTNTTPGSFKSQGDHATISKFSTLGFFDADHAGDYVEGSLASGSATALTTGTAKTIASISLPAGDWDVSGVVGYTPAGTTSVTRYSSSISLTTNTVGAEGQANINVFAAFVSGGFTVNYPTPVVRLSLAVTTTIYLVGFADFTVSTMTAFGRIRARKAGGR